jgi:hypothetical protein
MNDDPKIIQQLKTRRAVRHYEADCEFQQTRLLFRTCDSALEQQFLTGFLRRYSLYDLATVRAQLLPTTWHFRVGEYCLPEATGFVLRVWPQYVIARETSVEAWLDPGFPTHFRADFLFALTRFVPRIGMEVAVLRLLVELDGHSSHEKTRAQATRDKVRDRFLTASDFTPLHFTSSEVFERLESVLEELERFIKSRAVSTNFAPEKAVSSKN